jgi:hypothetical protein
MLLLPGIEWFRWKQEYGKKVNLDKWFTLGVAFTAWLIMVWAMGLFSWPVLVFGVCCVCIRGVFYDPSLNIFFGRYIDNVSETTNSKTDQWERKKKISFWMQRVLYLLAAIVFAVAYELLKLMNEV